MWHLLAALLALGGDGSEPLAGDSWAAGARARLAAAESAGPLSWGALLRSFYTHSAMEAAAGTEDIAGQVFEDADLYFALDQGPLSARLSADLGSGTAVLEDAFARWHVQDGLTLTVGQFKPRVTRSGSVAADALLLRERTFLGAAFDTWDDGFELGAHYDQFDGWLAVTDGANGNESDHFWSLRGEWALYDAAWNDVEGARGAPNFLRVLLGVETFQDVAQSASDGGGYGVDLALTFGPYAFHGEWADLDGSFARTVDVFNGHLITLGDGQPVAATLSRRVHEDFEAVFRYQRAGDADATHAVDLGLAWLAPGGARFVADLGLVDGDTRDFSIFSVGVELGSSGLVRPFLDGDGRL